MGWGWEWGKTARQRTTVFGQEGTRTRMRSPSLAHFGERAKTMKQVNASGNSVYAIHLHYMQFSKFIIALPRKGICITSCYFTGLHKMNFTQLDTFLNQCISK